MVKLEAGGDLDKQYVSVATNFVFIIITDLMYFLCELQCIFYEKNVQSLIQIIFNFAGVKEQQYDATRTDRGVTYTKSRNHNSAIQTGEQFTTAVSVAVIINTIHFFQ